MKLKTTLFGALLLVLSCAGCVERKMIITSEPSGATVIVNNSWRGVTPYTLKFMHYGVYGIRMEMEGYYPMIVKEPIKAPFYQQNGAEIVSEVLVPKRISDVRELHYVLQKIETEDSKEDVMQRADEMRGRMEAISKERTERDKTLKPINLPLPEKKKSKDAKGSKDKKDKDAKAESGKEEPEAGQDAPAAEQPAAADAAKQTPEKPETPAAPSGGK